MISNNLSNETLIEYIYKAAAEYEKLMNNTYLIVGKNSKNDYYFFECTFKPENFMHLVGVDSNQCSAFDFLMKCIEHNHQSGPGIGISYCTPAQGHNRSDINRKASCCSDILNLKNIRNFSIGEKVGNHFHYIYGSRNAVLEFKKIGKFTRPYSFMPGDTVDMHSKVTYKVLFIFKKENNKYRYPPEIELVPNLFQDLYDTMPLSLKSLIEYH